MPLAISIRTALDSDLAALTRNLTPDVQRAQLVNRFSEQRVGLRLMFVLEADGELAGTASLNPQPDEDSCTRRLFAIDVGRRFRRQGFATELIRDAESRVLADGHTAVRLDVAIDNLEAIELYEKLGYERVGQPNRLRWSRQVDGHPSEIVTDTSQRMVKKLR